ncbi:MAG: RNA-binding protein [Pseudomonadota bacterium]
MSRGGRRKDRAEGPERRCIATGESGPAHGLIRFVIGPDGSLTPDLAEKLPGRGIWVSSTREAVAKAIERRLFARAARQDLGVPEDLVDHLERSLAQRVVELLSLARKAGQAVSGYEKVKGWLELGEAVALLQASDGSERGKSKLKIYPEDGVFIDCLTADELGLSFGRDRAIHAALAAGGLAKRVVEGAAKLDGFRARGGAQAPGRTKNSHE